MAVMGRKHNAVSDTPGRFSRKLKVEIYTIEN
jgi:hypothetical protein